MEYSPLLHYYSLRYYYYDYHHHECIVCCVRVCACDRVRGSQCSVLGACLLKWEARQSQQLGVGDTILRQTIPSSTQIERVLGFARRSTSPQASVPAWQRRRRWKLLALRRIHGDARWAHLLLARAWRELLLQAVGSRDEAGGDGAALGAALHGREHLDGVSPRVVEPGRGPRQQQRPLALSVHAVVLLELTPTRTLIRHASVVAPPAEPRPDNAGHLAVHRVQVLLPGGGRKDGASGEDVVLVVGVVLRVDARSGRFRRGARRGGDQKEWGLGLQLRWKVHGGTLIVPFLCVQSLLRVSTHCHLRRAGTEEVRGG